MRSIRQLFCGRPRFASLFFLLLLITCVLFVAATGISAADDDTGDGCTAEGCIKKWEDRGCNVDDETACLISFFVYFSGYHIEYPSGLQPTIEQDGAGECVAEGQRVQLVIRCDHVGGDEHPQVVDLTWTPPPSAKDLRFANRRPDAQQGSSFVFHDVPVDYEGERPGTKAIRVSYEAPTLGKAEETTIVDTLQARFADESGAKKLRAVGSTLTVRRGPSVAACPTRIGEDLDADGVTYSRLETGMWYYDPNGPGFDTSLCEWLLSHRGKGEPFVGLRFPILTEPYTLPIVEEEGKSPIVSLLDESEWPHTTIVSTTLIYRPEYNEWLASNLPAEPNERWVALGIDATAPITCPEDLDIPATGGYPKWETYVEALIDLQVNEGDCVDADLGVYYCYEGTLPTTAQVALAGSLSRTGLSFVSKDGVTCVGPHILPISSCAEPDPPLALHGWKMVSVYPGDTITFCHSLHNLSQSSLDAVLTHTSELSMTWGVYAAADDGLITPLQPIKEEIRLAPKGQNGSIAYFCLCGTLPVDAVGSDTLVIQAANADDPEKVVHASDMILVKNWDILPRTSYRIDLPLVLKSQP